MFCQLLDSSTNCGLLQLISGYSLTSLLASQFSAFLHAPIHTHPQVYSLGAFSPDHALLGMIVAELQPLSSVEQEGGPVLDSATVDTTTMYIISLGECGCEIVLIPPPCTSLGECDGLDFTHAHTHTLHTPHTLPLTLPLTPSPSLTLPPHQVSTHSTVTRVWVLYW